MIKTLSVNMDLDSENSGGWKHFKKTFHCFEFEEIHQ